MKTQIKTPDQINFDRQIELEQEIIFLSWYHKTTLETELKRITPQLKAANLNPGSFIKLRREYFNIAKEYYTLLAELDAQRQSIEITIITATKQEADYQRELQEAKDFFTTQIEEAKKVLKQELAPELKNMLQNIVNEVEESNYNFPDVKDFVYCYTQLKALVKNCNNYINLTNK